MKWRLQLLSGCNSYNFWSTNSNKDTIACHYSVSIIILKRRSGNERGTRCWYYNWCFGFGYSRPAVPFANHSRWHSRRLAFIVCKLSSSGHWRLKSFSRPQRPFPPRRWFKSFTTTSLFSSTWSLIIHSPGLQTSHCM